MAESLSAADVRTVAVIGAGTMGHGIAQIAAASGMKVVLCDVEQGAVDRGLARIRANLDKGVDRGKLTPTQRTTTLANLTGVSETSVRLADLVIEAAPEKMEIKHAIFRKVEAEAPAHALLATNTSSLSIAKIAAVLQTPGRLIGMHFFNPVHIMKLLEIVRHDANDDAAVATARAWAERVGKTPIVVNDVPGFASSRLGIALGMEAIRMVEAGVASPADIDTAMKLGYGHPMGPLELTDLVGLDVRLHIAEYLAGELGPAFTPPKLLRDMVAAGKLGKKSGSGFYDW